MTATSPYANPNYGSYSNSLQLQPYNNPQVNSAYGNFLSVPNFNDYVKTLPANVQAALTQNPAASQTDSPYIDANALSQILPQYFSYGALGINPQTGGDNPQGFANYFKDGSAGAMPTSSSIPEQYTDAISGLGQATNKPSDSINGGGVLQNYGFTHYWIPAVAAMLTAGIGAPLAAGAAEAGSETAAAATPYVLSAGAGAATSAAQGGNPLYGALEGGASAYGSSLIGDQLASSFPESFAGNVAPSGGSSFDASYPNTPPTGGSALSTGGMTSAASVSPSVNFGSSGLSGAGSPFAQTDPLSAAGSGALGSSASIPNAAVANISGAAQPSIFDSLSQGNLSGAASGVGDFVQNNPLTTLAGAGAAYQGISSLGNQPSTSSLNPSPFSPTMQSAQGLPSSLSSYVGLDPSQQASNIASRGVYGGGQGPEEQNYFLNLMNRQLFDQSGNVASNLNNISPVDLSYLNQLGISGSSPTDYLKGISQFGT